MSEQEEAIIRDVDFEFALRSLKSGSRVRRAGWNGKGMWITLSPGNRAVPAENFWAPNNAEFARKQHTGTLEVLPYITMKTADDKIVPWVCSQTDLLAEDWELLRSK